MKKGWYETQKPRCVNRFKLLWTCTLSHSSTTEKVTGTKHKSCWFCPTNPIATPLQVCWFAQSNIALLSQNQNSWYTRAETVAYYTFINIKKKKKKVFNAHNILISATPYTKLQIWRASGLWTRYIHKKIRLNRTQTLLSWKIPGRNTYDCMKIMRKT